MLTAGLDVHHYKAQATATPTIRQVPKAGGNPPSSPFIVGFCFVKEQRWQLPRPPKRIRKKSAVMISAINESYLVGLYLIILVDQYFYCIDSAVPSP